MLYSGKGATWQPKQVSGGRWHDRSVQISLPAEHRRARNADFGVIMQPPAVCQAKGERKELRLCGELVGYQQAALAQQRLAVLDGGGHVPRGMQHVCSKEDVVGSQRILLQTEHMRVLDSVPLD